MPREPQRRLALKQLGFSEEPWSRSADDRFLYLSDEHGGVLRKMQDIIEERRALGVVTGRYGLGKSTIARRLDNLYRNEESQKEGIEVVYIHTATFDTEYDALMAVCRFLRLERRKGKNAQWEEFEQYLVNMAEKDRNVIIILDDAQFMKPDSMVFLHRTYNFDNNKKLVQVLVFGQPEVLGVFDKHPAVKTRVDGWYGLNPMPLEETLGLVTFRCRIAGREDPFLNEAALVNLHLESEGVPRTIVAICSKVVDVLGASGSRKTIADEAVMDQAIELYRSSLPPKNDQ